MPTDFEDPVLGRSARLYLIGDYAERFMGARYRCVRGCAGRRVAKRARQPVCPLHAPRPGKVNPGTSEVTLSNLTPAVSYWKHDANKCIGMHSQRKLLGHCGLCKATTGYRNTVRRVRKPRKEKTAAG